MVLGNWNLEWQNQNSQRSYPLSDDAGKIDVTGSFVLPDSFLLGLYLPVHTGLTVDATQFFLYSIAVFATGWNITIGYNSSPVTIVASVSVSSATHREGMAYQLVGPVGSDFDDTIGKIVLGDPTDINQQPAGQFLFNYAGGLLDPECIRPQIRGVSSLTVVNGSDVSARIYGDVQLVAGTNMQITIAQFDDDVTPTQIRLDAIDGTGLTENCECVGNGTTSTCISTINGIPPDDMGNFNLTGNPCLTVNPITNGLQLNDTCSQPCCGCTELEALTTELQYFGQQAQTAMALIQRLQGSVDQTSAVILGSRLGDLGCSTC